MHMADALLTPAVGAGFYGVSSATVAWSAWSLRRDADPRLVPTMGVLGAFVFAAQMINFAIPGTGSSGHLAGGMLLAAVLGPPAAFLVLTSVLAVQCLLFADGGLLALGANVFNLAFYPCFIGAPLAARLAGRSPSPARRSLSLAVSALASVELGALSVAVQTVASGNTSLDLGRFAALMAAIHLPIGVVEGLATAWIVALLWRLRPGLAEVGGRAVDRRGRAWAGTLGALGLAAVLTAGVFAWFASSRPDGLEWSLQHAGPASGAAEPAGAASPPDARLETTLDGLRGAGVVLLVAGLLAVPAVLWRRRHRPTSTTGKG
jgi:cobalt/nickel transport system permease protein